MKKSAYTVEKTALKPIITSYYKLQRRGAKVEPKLLEESRKYQLTESRIDRV
jgi:hypothetical protein